MGYNFGLGHGRRPIKAHDIARALSHSTKFRSHYLSYLRLGKVSHDVFVKKLYHA